LFFVAYQLQFEFVGSEELGRMSGQPAFWFGSILKNSSWARTILDVDVVLDWNFLGLRKH